jgi:hypothetical protein
MSNTNESPIIVKNVRSLRTLGYSPARLAKLTSISRGKIYESLNTGDLVGRKCGNRTVILHGDAIRWLKALPLYKES